MQKTINAQIVLKKLIELSEKGTKMPCCTIDVKEAQDYLLTVQIALDNENFIGDVIMAFEDTKGYPAFEGRLVLTDTNDFKTDKYITSFSRRIENYVQSVICLVRDTKNDNIGKIDSPVIV